MFHQIKMPPASNRSLGCRYPKERLSQFDFNRQVRQFRTAQISGALARPLGRAPTCISEALPDGRASAPHHDPTDSMFGVFGWARGWLALEQRWYRRNHTKPHERGPNKVERYTMSEVRLRR